MPERSGRRSRTAGIVAVLVAVLAALVAGEAVAEPPTGQDFALIERGRYLAVLADCGACHTSANGKAFAGGRPIQTPFGNVLAPNITPDRETGIGDWTDAQFDAALRLGRQPDGKRLYPAMPYVYYSRMSHADVLALRAYLDTLPPVHHAVVSDQLPFPYNIRASMWFWDALYFKPAEYEPQASKSAAWNRGAYIVEGPGHCGACHTPKTSLGGDKPSDALDGYSLQGWFSPNITNQADRGLGAWSAADIVAYLKSGHNRFAAASGPMAEEVMDSSSKMTDADLLAIATYLKDQPGAPPGAAVTTAGNDPGMTAGAAIYADLCSACHKPDGSGIPFLIPNLAKSAGVVQREPTSLLHVVLEGVRSAATDQEPTAPAMPEYGSQLNDVQIAAVLTYVRNSWGHTATAVTEEDVRKARRALNVADR